MPFVRDCYMTTLAKLSSRSSAAMPSSGMHSVTPPPAGFDSTVIRWGCLWAAGWGSRAAIAMHRRCRERHLHDLPDEAPLVAPQPAHEALHRFTASVMKACGCTTGLLM